MQRQKAGSRLEIQKGYAERVQVREREMMPQGNSNQTAA